MQAGYFKTAWGDIKNTRGWFGKMLLLALITCIPIFGTIVVSGYLYGWARDIAWGVRGPMPQRIFGNEDGKLYSRGFFVLVIGFVCALIPWAIELVWMLVTGTGSLMFGHGYGSGFSGGMFAFSGIMGLIFFVLTIAATFIAMLFQWVGSMRMSIYGRLSAGFQFQKMWAMIRHDFGGLMRIFGMTLLMGLVIGIVFTILFTIAFFILFALAMAVTGGATYRAADIDGTVWGLIMGFGGLAVLGMLVVGYVSLVIAVFTESIVVRALGYWMRQFDVPSWRGQDDPMPFELQATGAWQNPMPYQQNPPAGSQPQSHPYPQSGQQAAPSVPVSSPVPGQSPSGEAVDEGSGGAKTE